MATERTRAALKVFMLVMVSSWLVEGKPAFGDSVPACSPKLNFRLISGARAAAQDSGEPGQEGPGGFETLVSPAARSRSVPSGHAVHGVAVAHVGREQRFAKAVTHRSRLRGQPVAAPRPDRTATLLAGCEDRAGGGGGQHGNGGQRCEVGHWFSP